MSIQLPIAILENEATSEYYLDVYGRATEDVSFQLRHDAGIRYYGFTSYGELVKLMEESDFLIHAESFDDFGVKDHRAASPPDCRTYWLQGVVLFFVSKRVWLVAVI